LLKPQPKPYPKTRKRRYGGGKGSIQFLGTGTSPDVRAGLEPDEMNLLFNATTIPSAFTPPFRRGYARLRTSPLWDGEPGDGPGGTQHMVELVRKLTGRQPEIIHPTTL
jgi:hypothetical protein